MSQPNAPVSGSAAAQTTGARLVVDALLTHGVERVFCVPGESFLAVLDSLHDETERIQTIVCRHEAAAANMAEAVGKLTGRPGVALVTRGPGATHASIGVHTAFQDSTPMILLIGQCAREHLDREAFQEIDYRRMFGQMAKWVAQIDDPKRIPEYLSHAFHTATSGRPGPVVLSLPEDVLSDACEAVAGAPAYQRVAASPSAAQIEKLRVLLEGAQRPMVIAGGSGWTPAACADFRALRRELATAGRTRVPLSGHTRQRASELCRRRRPRHQSGAGAAYPRRRRAARNRTAFGRSDDQRLHAARHSEDQADARACASRCGGIGPRVCGGSADRFRHARAGSAACGVEAFVRQARLVGRGGRGASSVSRLAQTASDSRRRADGRSDPAVARASAGRRDSHQRCGQLRDVAASALFVSPLPFATRADERRDGLRRAGGDRGEVDVSATRCRRAGRRRLLHDGRARTRDGDAVRPARAVHRGE